MIAILFLIWGVLLLGGTPGYGFVPLTATKHWSTRDTSSAHSKCSNRERIHFSSLSLASSSSLSSADDQNPTFDQMKGMIRRLDNLESSAPDILFGFYEPHIHSFSVKPGQSDELSVTSTCYALLAIHLTSSSSSVYDSIICQEELNNNNDDGGVVPKKLTNKVCIPSVLQALLESQWREEDLFQVPLLLYTIVRLDQKQQKDGATSVIAMMKSNEQMAAKIRQMITAVLNARPRRRTGDRQAYSDYIYYQICRVLAMLQETTERPVLSELMAEKPPPQQQTNKSPQQLYYDQIMNKGEEGDFVSDFAGPQIKVGGLPANAVPDGAAAEISLALARCSEMASNELCRQIAYRTAGDSSSFDVIRLAYSLLTYFRSTQSLLGLAGRELIPGQGVSPGTQVTRLNERLLQAALDAFFDEQNERDGLWDKGQPIYQSFRRQGRNVGNAFVFSVHTVNSLLCALPAESFRPHLKSLERTLDWIERHETLEVIADYCDAETGECYGKTLRGWSSPHLKPEQGPLAWSTAQTLACVSSLKTTIQKLMHKDVLREFNGIAFSEKGIRPEGWERLLDTDLGSAVQNRTIKSVLEERVVTPFASSINNPSYGAAYSAILHGPPGTAKTTICEALAQRMGYDFLVIDTDQRRQSHPLCL